MGGLSRGGRRYPERHGTTTNDLINANCLSNPNVLEIGQQIRVPRTPLWAVAIFPDFSKQRTEGLTLVVTNIPEN